MNTYRITATLIKQHEIDVVAESKTAAYNSLNGWISDDFEDYEINAEWRFETELMREGN